MGEVNRKGEKESSAFRIMGIEADFPLLVGSIYATGHWHLI